MIALDPELLELLMLPDTYFKVINIIAYIYNFNFSL